MPASRRSRPWANALVLSAVLALACHRPPEPEGDPGGGVVFTAPPNVILLVVDTLRRDHVGAYGYHRETTPFLDRLAEQGVVFDNAYAQASHTFVSTATLLTSRYFPFLEKNEEYRPIPGLNEELRQLHALMPQVSDLNRTLPEVLRDGGYETVGLFTNPHHHATSGFWQGFDRAEYLLRRSGAGAYARGPMVHQAFFEWLDGRRSDRPYFAFLHFMDVHAPYRPPRALRRRFVTVGGDERWASGRPEGKDVPTPDDVALIEALYDGEIRFVDSVIEALVTDLKRRDQWSTTLLVVTSDHGEEFMDHGGLRHGRTLESEQIRIPLVIAGGGVEERGLPGRRPELVRNLDLAPTILDAAGIAIPPQFEGRSLLRLLVEEAVELRHPGTSFAWTGSLRSITDGDWHFVWDGASGQKILYDQVRDPLGRRDLSAERSAVVAELTAAIRRYEQVRRASERFVEEHRSRSPRPPQELDPEIVEQLEALGYL